MEICIGQNNGFNGMGDLLHLEGYKIKLIEELSDFNLCEG